MISPPREERVSVVVLTHNRKIELGRTLAKLEAMNEKPHIVVVDNASTDGTPAMLRASFPDVTVVNARRNVGAAGRNLGVARVHTRYVAFCDDDTWWEDGALSRAAELLDAHPNIAVLSAAVRVGETNRPDATCERMAGSPLPRHGLPGPALVGFMAGACVFRVRAYREAGGYEPRLFIGGEEELLALDLLAAGWAIVYAAQLTLFHHPSPLRDGAGRRRLLARNSAWIALMRLPLREALGAAARAAVTQLEGGFSDLAVFVLGLHWAWQRRRPVPTHILEWRDLVRQSAGKQRASA
ncbi:MAG: family 2 glycosyl transferase [Bradyrhizobium sp.]|nr:family 2 glycosyl transferase [Bradyrhizobium sp.]